MDIYCIDWEKNYFQFVGICKLFNCFSMKVCLIIILNYYLNIEKKINKKGYMIVM